MIKVKNTKIINRIAFSNFKEKKSRNKIAILAIILTSILFTTIFTLGMGTIEIFQRAMMEQVGGSGHGSFKYITEEIFNDIKDHPLIDEIAENWILADDIKNPEVGKRKAELWYCDDVGIKLRFAIPTGGHIPEAVDEVLVDTISLKLLGIPLEEGAPITLELVVHERPIQRTFKLSGWYEPSPLVPSGMMITSRAYLEQYKEELTSHQEEGFKGTGTIHADVMFKNSIGLRSKLDQVIEESGYSLNEEDEKYINSNVSWAYLSTYGDADPLTILMLVGALLLVILTGYLIIYNVFQLSVVQDIHFYGLLKTIGTTGKQIKRIIRREALLLGVISIPIGLILGFLLGKVLVPYVVNSTTIKGVTIHVSPSPWIFIGSAAFGLFTIWLSTKKPGKMAAKVSPVEAVKYTEGVVGYKKQKHSTTGGKLHKMAISNLGRNKKQTVIVMLSMALSLVLFNMVYSLSQSVDMEEYISTYIDTDYVIAYNEYFKSEFSSITISVPETFIEEVTQLEGFEEGGRVYNNTFTDEFYVTDRQNTGQDYNINAEGDFFAQVIGLEDELFKNAVIREDNVDEKMLESGEYIYEAVFFDDNRKLKLEDTIFDVGEEIELHYYKYHEDGTAEYMTRSFIVGGYIEVHHRSNHSQIGIGPYNFYLPASVYAELVPEPIVMNYAFNVKEGYKREVEAFLKHHTEEVDITTNYTCRGKLEEELSGASDMMVLVGGAITFIIALIGVLNFMNANLTGILTRRKEFAMLQSIGMTGRQLKKVLIYEGLYYTLGTLGISMVLGILSSITIVKMCCDMMNCFTYQFMIWPIGLVAPILVVIGIILPIICYRYLTQQSIVERLRQT